MKKLLSIFCTVAVILTMSTAESFSQNKIYTKFSGAETTLTNADTTYFTVSNVGAHEAASFQFNIEKTTGTLAGKAWLEVSNNNSTWLQISAADTLNIGNSATQGILWNKEGFNYRSARIKVITSSGTSTPTVAAYFIKPR